MITIGTNLDEDKVDMWALFALGAAALTSFNPIVYTRIPRARALPHSP
jgi:hypothetical protein